MTSSKKIKKQQSLTQGPVQILHEPEVMKDRELAKKKDNESVNNVHFLKALLSAITNSFNGNYWRKDIHGVYRECNQKLIVLLGLNSVDDFVGKTDYELPWKETADQLIANDHLVISNKEVLSYEEHAIDADGKEHIFQVTKAPLFDENNQVIGTIGTSIDITAHKEAEKLRIENERQQIALQEQEKFSTLARKVAHDIKNPLSALRVMINACEGISEAERIRLQRALESIWDIANNLIANYQVDQSQHGIEAEAQQALLVSDLLVQLLSETKMQYKDKPIRFKTEIAENAQFAFTRTQKSEFRRAISNLISNAVDALKEKTEGEITVRLSTTSHAVMVKVEDNGKGMSAQNADKMERGRFFTEGKENGHGLGMQQVWDMLQSNLGRLTVQSELGQGTTITLTFPRITAAKWVAQEMRLAPDQIIVVLDDEPSIHDAWNMHFSPLLANHPEMQLHHFTEGSKALSFINGLVPSEKDNVMLLSDYELLHQDRNGIDIIQASKIKQSILVTSYYGNAEIREAVTKLKVKILPKQMASVIPIHVE
jgi:PAS domain S-box-containing protein